MGLTKSRAARLCLSLSLLGLLLLSSLVCLPAAEAFEASGQYASTVIGEPNFVSATNEAAPNRLYHPFRMAFDSEGDLWVADENNNRVLEFKPPFTTGESASVEIGEANFTSIAYTASQDRLNEPVGLTFDQQGDLWVMDTLNNRILEFKPPFTDGMNASLELGQPAGPDEFTSNSPSSGPGGFDFPVDAAFDSHGDLWVSDRVNNRILEFEPPFSNGMNASSVIGQLNTTYVSNYVVTSPSGLSGPNGIAFDAQGNLWVADETNNRILEFPASSLGTNDPSAVLEIGHPAGNSAFSSSAFATNRSGFAAPLSIAFDASGNLWVSDRANNRVLEFDAPFSDGMLASAVVGTAPGPRAFDENDSGLSQTQFWNPLGIAFDQSGDLWVADQLNNRVLEFSAAATDTAALDVDVPVTATQSEVSVTGGNTCYQAGTQSVCHITADQASTTGVVVDLIGVASATHANVYTSDLSTSGPGAPPPGGPIGSPLGAYGVVVTGLQSGTATVCLDNKGVTSSTGLAYYDGTSWGSPTSLSTRPGVSVCGTIPISVLSAGDSVVVIGQSSASASELGTAGLVALVVVLVGALAYGYSAMTRRRAPALLEPEADEGEGW